MTEAACSGLRIRAFGRPGLDIEDSASIDRIIAGDKPAAIINAAGMVDVDEAERKPDRAFAVNRDGAALLAGAAARAGIPFVHVSSDYVFDGRKSAPYVEHDRPAPLSVYGQSKLAGEQAVVAAHSEAVIVRTSWLFGSRGRNFLTVMLRLAESQDVVRVVTDQRGSPTGVSDFARALIEMTRQLLDGGSRSKAGIYHVAGAGEATWFGLAEAIFSGWRRRGFRTPRVDPISSSEWTGPARRPPDSRLDCTKAKQTFGIALPDWHDAVERHLDELARSRALL